MNWVLALVLGALIGVLFGSVTASITIRRQPKDGDDRNSSDS